jgi:AcrR family transcriptional regulator
MVKSFAPAESTDSAGRIRSAAFRRLLKDGYAGLSTRDIAAEAGVNHALIHYYFGTKDKLVIAALDEVNEQLLERQRAMYATSGGFAEKWAQALQFYEDDLVSGFVRVQMELWGASLSNPVLRELFYPRILAWRRVVEGAVREALEHYDLSLPFSADAIACWIFDFWVGMEFEMVLGASEEEGHHHKAMAAMQQLLEMLDARASHERPGATDKQSDPEAPKRAVDGSG